MKKFKFRLERLLQIRAHIEKEKQKLLGQAAHKVAAQENYLTELNHCRCHVQEQERHFLGGRLNTHLLSNYSRYYLKLKKNELTGRELLRVLISEREKKRQDLVEATKQKKIYEKIKERKLVSYHRETEMIMQKEQDEMASQMLVHKKSSRLQRELLDNKNSI
jgi:flagellar FliJ protein